MKTKSMGELQMEEKALQNQHMRKQIELLEKEIELKNQYVLEQKIRVKKMVRGL